MTPYPIHHTHISIHLIHSIRRAFFFIFASSSFFFFNSVRCDVNFGFVFAPVWIFVQCMNEFFCLALLVSFLHFNPTMDCGILFYTTNFMKAKLVRIMRSLFKVCKWSIFYRQCLNVRSTWRNQSLKTENYFRIEKCLKLSFEWKQENVLYMTIHQPIMLRWTCTFQWIRQFLLYIQ